MNTGLTRTCAAAASLVTLIALAACGSSDAGNVAGSDITKAAAAAEESGGAAQDPAQGDVGKVTVTIDGTTTTAAAGTCRIITTSDKNLSLNNGSLHLMLPPEPGDFDNGQVILPPPPGDEYSPVVRQHGSWTRDGDTATGHVEGDARLLSNVGSGEEKRSTYSIDFSCPIAE